MPGVLFYCYLQVHITANHSGNLSDLLVSEITPSQLNYYKLFYEEQHATKYLKSMLTINLRSKTKVVKSHFQIIAGSRMY